MTALCLAGTLASCAGSQPDGSRDPSAAQAGIPRLLLSEARPVGRGPRFQPPVRGPIIGRCRPRLRARNGVHVEVFEANRVVIVPRGIGAAPPLVLDEGRISHARCFGSLVTLEPTGVVLVAAGSRPRLEDLFHSWGEALAPFDRAYVDGARWPGTPGSIPLSRHAEIVVEAGPRVPPHHSYTFPPGS